MPTAHSLSPSDLDTLEALARAATPGKRELHEHLITETSVCIPHGPTDCRGLGSIELGYADTELAVACDPETILALVSELRGWRVAAGIERTAGPARCIIVEPEVP